MAKRKGSSTSGPRGRKKVAKEGRAAKTRVVVDESNQLSSLDEKRAEVSEEQQKPEQLERQLEEEKLRAKVMEQMRNLGGEELADLHKYLTEVENTQHLDKLPQKVWEKILDNLGENDLFPLALSCRYFRQKQKELVARSRQSGPESGEPRRALKTSLKRKLKEGTPATTEYLRFLSKEEVSKDVGLHNDSWIVRLAAFHGHLPLLQELIERLRVGDLRKGGLGKEIAVNAVEGAQEETLKWLKSKKGYKLNGFDLSNACKRGHLEVLKWLRSENCPWDAGACVCAAEGGQLEALKWLREEGCPWDGRACIGAARGGHLETLKWLREEGCPWDKWTCSGAARRGHLNVLRWAIENGCPYEVNLLWNKPAVKVVLRLECSAREAENAKRLDKLPPEVWEKVLDNLESDDLFPLALSCRYFRQKQEDLEARASQRGPESGKPHLALKTNLFRKFEDDQPASAEYLRFCGKEKVPSHFGDLRTKYVRLLAAYHGHLPLLQELLAGLRRLDAQITESAAYGGQLETLQWLKAQEGFELDTRLFASACRGGNLEVVKWLRSKGCYWNADACSWAAREGHLDVLKWLRNEGCPWDKSACEWAARYGHLEILKWLRSKGCPWDARACEWAARYGHLDVLKWLRSEGCPWNASACAGAAEHGRLECLQWLRSEGCPWDKSACAAAARCGHLEILKWLRSKSCPWNEETCAYAAKHGRLETLKWLRSKGCPWDETACARAANGGHLDVLRWLRSEGCPWSEGSCSNAASGGHLEVLNWLRSAGCPWDESTCVGAATGDHLEMLEWAIENGCPCEANDYTRGALMQLGYL